MEEMKSVKSIYFCRNEFRLREESGYHWKEGMRKPDYQNSSMKNFFIMIIKVLPFNLLDHLSVGLGSSVLAHPIVFLLLSQNHISIFKIFTMLYPPTPPTSLPAHSRLRGSRFSGASTCLLERPKGCTVAPASLPACPRSTQPTLRV